MQQHQLAERLVKGGLSVIPILTDGSKRPAVPWKEFQKRKPDDRLLQEWCRNGNYGFAVVGGQVSGNLEILDFDEGSLLEPWQKLVDEQIGPDLLAGLPIVVTPSTGFHIYYRCKGGVEGNQKLAQRMGQGGCPEVTIETRGEGGYALLPGSPLECHLLKQPYILVQGDLAQIPTIRAAERQLLLDSARALNDYVDSERIISSPSRQAGDRPGDDFNRRAHWEQVLEPHGWKKVGGHDGRLYWRRPGKEVGISATTNFARTDQLYVFSTNAHPFESGRAYDKFAAYTRLNHRGNFTAAAQDLADRGYRQPQDPFFAYSAFSAPSDSELWPRPLGKEAFHGLAGDILRTIEPHTESDSAALLLQLLTAFGSVAGREPYWQVEADRHGLNLFIVIVGETAKSRKGTSWGRVLELFKAVDQDWAQDRVQSGLSSGEGLIWAVRDPVEKLEPLGRKKREKCQKDPSS